MFCSKHNFEMFECITDKYGNFKKGKLYPAFAKSIICNAKPWEDRYSMFKVRDEDGDSYGIYKSDIGKLFVVAKRKNLKNWDKLCTAIDEIQYSYNAKTHKPSDGLKRYKLTIAEFRAIQSIVQDILYHQSPFKFKIGNFNDTTLKFFERFGYKISDNDGVINIISEGYDEV